MTKPDIDKLDERILAELDNDARQLNSGIAKKLRVNKSVVNYKIKNLEKKGIINGYYAVIDTYRLGYSSYRAYLKFQYTTPEKEDEIMKYLIDLPQTWWIGQMSGKFDVAALFWVKNQDEFVEIWINFNKKFRNNIKENIVVIYYGLEHYRLPFTKNILREDAGVESIGVGNTIKYDETDLKILRFVSSNARASLMDISKIVDLSPVAVQYRLKQLKKKKLIRGYRASIDVAKLGYTLYKININLKDLSAYERIRGFVREHSDIFYLDKTIGWADVEIELYTKTPQRFYEVLKEIRTTFADVIRDEDYFVIPKITKILYMSGE